MHKTTQFESSMEGTKNFLSHSCLNLHTWPLLQIPRKTAVNYQRILFCTNLLILHGWTHLNKSQLTIFTEGSDYCCIWIHFHSAKVTSKVELLRPSSVFVPFSRQNRNRSNRNIEIKLYKLSEEISQVIASNIVRFPPWKLYSTQTHRCKTCTCDIFGILFDSEFILKAEDIETEAGEFGMRIVLDFNRKETDIKLVSYVLKEVHVAHCPSREMHRRLNFFIAFIQFRNSKLKNW